MHPVFNILSRMFVTHKLAILGRQLLRRLLLGLLFQPITFKYPG